MIFNVLKTEDVVQVDDKTRLDASKSFSADGETLSLVEIDPDNSGTFYDVTSSQYLDWQYSTDGTKTVVLRVTGSVSPVQSITKTLEVITAADDLLFSSDKDLVAWESDILRYVPKGRNSYLDKHRESQKLILQHFSENRIKDSAGEPIVKEDIFDITEVREWSKFLTLSIIFFELHNQVDDVFMGKHKKYESFMKEARGRAEIRFDFDQDGTVDRRHDLRSGILVRR